MFQNENDQTILEQLRSIGLAETDARVYLACIQLGACSIGQITTKTKINRITTHDSVGRLIIKGLLLETYSGKRRLVYPQQVSSLQYFVDHKKSELDQLQLNISKTINMLSSLQLQSHYLPRIRISKGRQGITDMIHEIKEEASDQLNIICDSRHFDELLNVHFLDNLSKFPGSIRMILPAGFEHFIFSAYAKGLHIETKTMRENLQRSGGMTIRGNSSHAKIALHAYEGIFITTTIIENNPIQHMMKDIFQNMRITQ